MKSEFAMFRLSTWTKAGIITLFLILATSCRPSPAGGVPVCSPESLQAPSPITPIYSPVSPIVDSLTPTFTWSYPDPACVPESYQLDYSTTLIGVLGTGGAMTSQVVDGSVQYFVPTSPLSPGTMYHWRIHAKTARADRVSWDWIFFTGPRCNESDYTPSGMMAPTLVSPDDGAVRSTLDAFLEWQDPTPCIPQGNYLVELSTNSSFTHPSSYHAELGMTNVGAGRDLDFNVPLRDCTHYYWRVRMDIDGHPDATDGPWSPTLSFRTNVTGGFCPSFGGFGITPIPPDGIDIPLITPEPSSWIDGYVWHDLCALPYESTDIAPPGCIWVDPIHGYEADGIAQAGEPGIEGVTVRLGAGACPSTGLATTTTAIGGHYLFGPLPAGTYCVSIDPVSEENVPVLIPGGWTFPERDAEIGQYEITLADIDIHRENNFGWDYQFLPAPSSSKGIPTATLLQNTNCRRGPGLEYEVFTSLLEGLRLQIDGRNMDSSWLWVLIPNSLDHCWIGGNMAQTSGDVGKAPVVEGPPLGCWVNQQQGPDKCVAPCPSNATPGGSCTP